MGDALPRHDSEPESPAYASQDIEFRVRIKRGQQVTPVDRYVCAGNLVVTARNEVEARKRATELYPERDYTIVDVETVIGY